MANDLPKTRPAVFLDRDGVLNLNRDDYVKSVAELEIYPFAGDALAKLNRAGFLAIVISNQQGVGKGLLDLDQLDVINRAIGDFVAASGGEIKAFYTCPHLEQDGCDCRKPSPGNIFKAAQDFGIDLSKSYFIGDSLGDMMAADAAGVKKVLVLCGQVRPEDVPDLPLQPDAVCADLAEAADFIVAEAKQTMGGV